ncbi:MAG: hypothetical protein L0Y76_11125 [Ignavibacteria bacterium]|nr:hypothetical protein [Ignavibacteria bacterium]
MLEIFSIIKTIVTDLGGGNILDRFLKEISSLDSAAFFFFSFALAILCKLSGKYLLNKIVKILMFIKLL